MIHMFDIIIGLMKGGFSLSKEIRETKTVSVKTGKVSKGNRLQEVFGVGGPRVDMILRSIVPTIVAKDETITSKTRLMKYLLGFLSYKFGGESIFPNTTQADVFLRYSTDAKSSGICDKETFMEVLKNNAKKNVRRDTTYFAIDRIVHMTATQVYNILICSCAKTD